MRTPSCLTVLLSTREGHEMTVTIDHNPACGTSRNTLVLIRNSGADPEVIGYLKTPPSRHTLLDLMLDILPDPQRAASTKEHGEQVVDADGHCVI